MSPQPESSFRNKLVSRGFTLVEVLVALTILTTALVPAFVLASNAVSLSVRIRNSLIASNLAQEGVELVRATRDANWFSGLPFDTALDGCGGGCVVQYDEPSPNNLGSNPFLMLDPATGRYQYTKGGDSPFRRKITITKKGDAELYVVSEVAWKERTVDRTFKLEYYLYDWVK